MPLGGGIDVDAITTFCRSSGFGKSGKAAAYLGRPEKIKPGYLDRLARMSADGRQMSWINVKAKASESAKLQCREPISCCRNAAL